MIECFLQTNLKLSEDSRIFNEYKNFDYRHMDVPKIVGRERKAIDVVPSSTFKRAKLPGDYFKNEKIHDFIQEFNLMLQIFLIEPGYIYNWHRDAYRHLAFNCMIGGDDDYLVLWSHEYPNGLLPSVTFAHYSYFPTTRLIYNPRQFYFFNSQIPHISINFSSQPRYVLTMAEYVKEPLECHTTGIPDYDFYEATKEKLKNLGYIDS
jgi:hypothetical protein